TRPVSTGPRTPRRRPRKAAHGLRPVARPAPLPARTPAPAPLFSSMAGACRTRARGVRGYRGQCSRLSAFARRQRGSGESVEKGEHGGSIVDDVGIARVTELGVSDAARAHRDRADAQLG